MRDRSSTILFEERPAVDRLMDASLSKRCITEKCELEMMGRRSLRQGEQNGRKGYQPYELVGRFNQLATQVILSGGIQLPASNQSRQIDGPSRGRPHSLPSFDNRGR